jgi:dolichol-phosphate mannosyltransferase
LILVDDGSTDTTAQTSLDESHSLGISLRLVQHSQNAGLGQAIKTGLTTFLEVSQEGDFVATMDCDNTQPPELLIKMYNLIVAGSCDIAIASRYKKGSRVIGLSTFRMLMSYGVSWLFRIMAPISGVKDYTCGYRIYNRSLLVNLFEYYRDNLFTEKGFACMIDLLLKTKLFNPQVTEVPMVLRYDQKPTASKMKVLKTIVQTLKILSKNIWFSQTSNNSFKVYKNHQPLKIPVEAAARH